MLESIELSHTLYRVQSRYDCFFMVRGGYVEEILILESSSKNFINSCSIWFYNYLSGTFEGRFIGEGGDIYISIILFNNIYRQFKESHNVFLVFA